MASLLERSHAKAKAYKAKKDMQKRQVHQFFSDGFLKKPRSKYLQTVPNTSKSVNKLKKGRVPYKGNSSYLKELRKLKLYKT